MTLWPARRVLLTGAGGFLGSHLRERLESLGVAALFAPPRAELDLRDGVAVTRYLDEKRPNLVIHAAANVGGIGANRAHPGQFFHDNALMGIQLIEASRRAGVEKFLCLGTVCAYPKFTPLPFRESDLWNGYPEETNAPYGLAKRMLLVQLQAYRQEYGFNGIYLLPANLYGPRDNFDLETSHVIPAMIRKFVEADEESAPVVTLWGDGTPTREFLHVTDAADAVLLAAERYDGAEPVNIGTGESVSIAQLADLVADATGYRGRIEWNVAQPGGQPKRQLDTTRAREAFGFTARVRLADGLREAVAWYKTRRPPRPTP
ncbi:MAG: GDP-L-fucose synthase [Acidobacteria bacterium]|nr:GDP-L-fucose synthase [Acidobacteriota bacterium]MBV9477820.1 GDP-L-fucose synthase [Acidobacteriota bacterium]